MSAKVGTFWDQFCSNETRDELFLSRQPCLLFQAITDSFVDLVLNFTDQDTELPRCYLSNKIDFFLNRLEAIATRLEAIASRGPCY